MDFDTAAARRGTNSVKWDRASIMSICSNPDAEPFWVADMDFLPEEHAKAAGLRIAELGVYGYPVFRTLEEADVSAAMKKILKDLEELGIELRQ